MEFLSNNARQTQAFAEKIAAKLKPGDVLAFEGDLGAGKTTFTAGLVKGLGIDDWVSSPTFALVYEYSGNGKTVCHFDMYRIDSPDDLYSTGFFDYLDGERIMLIEWSERIPYALPENTIKVRMQVLGENTRKITIEGDERFADSGI